jgi:hypothetical protein
MEPAPPSKNLEVEASGDGSDPALLDLGREHIDNEVLQAFGARISSIKKARASAPKLGDQNTVCKILHKEKRILIPKGIINDEANLIGLMIGKLACDMGYGLELYNSTKYSYDEPTREVRNFFLGMCIGTDDLINLKIRVRNDIVETGRACSFAIRVRGHFRNKLWLGTEALRRDQTFFGNDPKVDKKTKALSEYMILDSYLAQYLSDKTEVGELRRLITACLESVGLSGMEPHNLKACISSNVVSYSDIIDRFRRKPLGEMKPKKRDGKKSELGKLPEKPSSSPLITKEEMDEYHTLTTFIWSALDPYTKEYMERLNTETYKGLVARVQSVFNIRWEMLTAFATVTTRRLQELKKLEEDKKITKRKVDESALAKLLTRRRDPVLTWYRERSDLLKPLLKLDALQRDMISKNTSLWSKIDLTEASKDKLMFELTEFNKQLKEESNPEPLERGNQFAILEEKVKETKKVIDPSFKKLLIELMQYNEKKQIERRYYLRTALKETVDKLWEEKKLMTSDSDLISTALTKSQSFGPSTDVCKSLNFKLLDKVRSWKTLKSTEIGLKDQCWVYVPSAYEVPVQGTSPTA